MDLYQKADIFLLNTGYEGFSHQILEIMAAGIPIITTDAGGNKEIIRDGENALIASYNEKREWRSAIERLLKDTDLQKKIEMGGMETASHYTKEEMVKRTVRLFGSL